MEKTNTDHDLICITLNLFKFYCCWARGGVGEQLLRYYGPVYMEVGDPR